MTRYSIPSIRLGKTAQRNVLLTPALFVSIAIAIFAVVTQLLDATGVISLSTTQQLTMWLVALGLIVLLAIAYMASSAYIIPKRPQEAPPIPKRPEEAPPAQTGPGATGLHEARSWPATTGRQAHDGKADIEQARAAVEEAEARLGEARATKDAAEQGAKAARAQAVEAERDAVRQEARAGQAAEQLRAAVDEAEARLAEWEAVEVADWHKAA